MKFKNKYAWAVLAAGFCLQTAAADQHAAIPLYGQPPQAVSYEEIHETLMGEPRVRNVSQPTLSVYPASTPKPSGTAVIIAPGGGFQMLSIQSEGDQVAKWLAARGVSAFVLKYRLNETPADAKEFQAKMTQQFQSAMSADATAQLAKTEGAQHGMADGLAAVRLVRQRAAEFHIKPDRIGILGFSAGGIVAMHVATGYDAASRPNFVGSIYGALEAGGTVPDDAPPVFLAVAADDPLLAGASAPIFAAWRAKNKLAELHVYQKGGHGFGMNAHGNSSDHWNEEFYWWLQSQGWAGAVAR